MHKGLLLLSALFLTAGFLPAADLGGTWTDPGFNYMYEGNAPLVGAGAIRPAMRMDGTWHRCTNSDEWEGSGLGDAVGAPGGMEIVNLGGGNSALRVVDAGDPRSIPPNYPDPSNRKLSSGHDCADELGGFADSLLDTGVTFVFSIRATPPAEIVAFDMPVPPALIGYPFQTNGTKGAIMLSSRAAGAANDRNQSLNFTIRGNDLMALGITADTAAITIPLGDSTQLVKVWATCQKNPDPATNHKLRIWINGELAPRFDGDVTLTGAADQLRLANDSGSYDPDNFMIVETEQTASVGAVDVDYIGYKAGVVCPSSIALASQDFNGEVAGWVGYTTWDGCQGYDVGAGGNDIWGVADQFRYAYTPGGVRGDFVAATYLDVSQLQGGWSRTGVMCRAELTPGSRMMMIAVTGGNGIQVERRTEDLNGVGHRGSRADPLDPDRCFVAQVKQSDILRHYWSNDGAAWNLHSAPTYNIAHFGPSPYVGLAVGSHGSDPGGAGAVRTAFFRNVTIVSAPTNITCVPVGADVVVSWMAHGAANGFNVYRDGVLVASVAGNVTSYREAQPAAAAAYEVKAVLNLLAAVGLPPELGGGGICTFGPPVDIRTVGTLHLKTWNAHGCSRTFWTPAWNLATITNGNEGDTYDTWNGCNNTEDEYIGFEFRGPNGEYQVRSVLQYWFKESSQFGDGGWFDSLALEVLVGGKWVPTGIISTPPYAGGNGISDEIYQWDVPGIAAAGVRIHGDPGGSCNFISVREEKGFVGGVVGTFPTVAVIAPETAMLGDEIGARAIVGDVDIGDVVTILGWDVDVNDGVHLIEAGLPNAVLPMTTAGDITVSCYVRDSKGNTSIGTAKVKVGGWSGVVSNDGTNIDGNGFIKTWLILGPLGNSLAGPSGTCGPTADQMRRDFLADGAGITEANIEPYAGLQVNVDFAGASAATTRLCGGWPELNAGGIPAFFLHKSVRSTISNYDSGQPRNNSTFGWDHNDMMTYYFAYVQNNTGAPIVATAGGASDDSLQVVANGVEVLSATACRGYGGDADVQNWSSNFELKPGTNTIIMKTFEGGGGSGGRLCLQNATTGARLREPDVTIAGGADAPLLKVTQTAAAGGVVILTAETDLDSDEVVWDLNPSDGIQANAVGKTLEFAEAPGIYSLMATAIRSKALGGKTFSTTFNASVTHVNVRVDTLPPVFNPVTPPALPLPLYARYFKVLSLSQGAWQAVYSIVEPAGATMDPASGRVEWQITQAGPVTFTAKVANNFGEATTSWTITVSPDALADDFDADPLANPLWALDDPNPGTVFTTADGKFTWDQPRVGPGGSDFDNWCGFCRTPFLFYPVDSLMDFGVQTELDYTRVDTGGCSNCSHHGIMLDLPNRWRDMFGMIRDYIAAEHCDGPLGGGYWYTGMTYPIRAFIRLEKRGSEGNFRMYAKASEADPWSELSTNWNAEQPTRAGLFVKNWGGADGVHSLTNFYSASIGGLIYGPEGFNCAMAADGTSVDLTWQKPAKAGWTSVEIRRDGVVVATVAGDATSYTDPVGADWGTGYVVKEFRIAAVDAREGRSLSGPCWVGHVSEGFMALQDGLISGVASDQNANTISDAFILAYNGDGNQANNTGASTSFEEGDWDGGANDHKDMFIKFDPAAIPAGTDVKKATLSLWYWYERRGINPTNPHQLFALEVLKDWNEGTGTGTDGRDAQDGEICWTAARYLQEDWEAAGAVGFSDVGIPWAAVAFDPTVGQHWVDFDITTAVKTWVKFPAQNKGLKITQNPGNDPAFAYVQGAYDFVASELGDKWARPKLVLEVSVYTPPTNLACAVAGHNVDLTWKNNDTYTKITLKGAPGGDINIPPASQSYTLTVPCGSYNLTLRTEKGTNFTELNCSASVDLVCPTGIAATAAEDDITATWTNGDTYTQIEVFVDGASVAVLPGTDATYTAVGLAPGAHEICIQAKDAGCTCEKLCASATVAVPPMKFIRGDANADGELNIADAVKNLDYQFGHKTVVCVDALDTNDDGEINIADAVKLLSALFTGGTMPPPNACGIDPTADALGCDSFPPCPQGW